MWPGFAIKSIGLLFLVAGVITAMGALFHVNAIWLYGPYDPGAATSFSQPDWYIGFLEGSLRLFPPWETRVGRFMINNVVYSGVIVPGIIFTGLLLVPWIERRFTKDDREHHLLDRPRDQPHRTAAGVAATTFVAVLFLGGSQDVIAGTLNMSIGTVTAILQFAALLGPPIAYYVTWRAVPGADDATGPGPHRAGRRHRARRRRRVPRGRRGGGRAQRGGGRVEWHRCAAQLPPPLTEEAADIDRVWNGFLLAALVVGAARRGAHRLRRRALPAPRHGAAAPAAREHPGRGDVHRRAAADRRRPVRRHVRVRRAPSTTTVDDPELTVEVTGFQWQWQFVYPDAGVRVIGTDEEVPELVLPAATSVRFDADVRRRHPLVLDHRVPLQARHVPRRGADVRRRRRRRRTGEFPTSGVCAEFCGLDHTSMRFAVRIVTPDEFDDWLQDRSQEAAS